MTAFAGEFEHLVLLSVLRHDGGATARDIRDTLAERAGRTSSRGALYATLDRLDEKGWIGWAAAESAPERGGVPARRVVLTEAGLAVARERQRAVRRLVDGTDLATEPS